ncbi:SDR family oxidoreductase [Burkholderia gladioli]|uniref:SDR family oxidoreductase n=1 Tax=Burkholderia gladioli TaxID=28095 RepID=UPI00163ED812|nr:SDR family oxidoreductase [Burkholderia gladioli]
MNHVVLVTGACGGIGRVLCRRFVEQGDTVLALDRDGAALAALPGVRPVVADLTDGEAVRAAVDAAVREAGPVGILVANAGAAVAGSLASTRDADWRRDIDLNLNGTYYSVEAVRASMIERRRGNIVVIGSVNGATSLGHPAYSAAKAGLVSYTRALATEFGQFGIRANIVCPGTVKTQAWEARIAKDPAVLEKLRKWYPLGDFPNPNDIADAVLFLASEQARMITGVMLPVDGGLLAGNRLMAAELTLESF